MTRGHIVDTANLIDVVVSAGLEFRTNFFSSLLKIHQGSDRGLQYNNNKTCRVM